jgi:glutamate N-acetyltransferase/amino-acid N-acetyltransferase
MIDRLPPGFAAAAVSAGIYKKQRLDLCLLVADQPGPAWAMWTRNLLQGASILVNREHLVKSGGTVKAVLINSGCANCATGEQGLAAARELAKAVASQVDCKPHQVLVFSTGVIGAQLPVAKMIAALPGLQAALSPTSLGDAARAIMTTDTFDKRTSMALEGLAEPAPTITGIAKGSGMIHPDMATMLVFLFTDASTTADTGIYLRAAVDRSFNMVTVDGDTSPNDSVLLWSSARVQLASGEPEQQFMAGLDTVCRDLALAIARDGEGATKLVTVQVRGARSWIDGKRCAQAIATSPLVKTAIHGEDPNWGRILTAAGRAGIYMVPQQAKVGIGAACLYDQEGPHSDREPDARAHLQGKEVLVWIDLGFGGADVEVYTCDFSADYVKINADYRT